MVDTFIRADTATGKSIAVRTSQVDEQLECEGKDPRCVTFGEVMSSLAFMAFRLESLPAKGKA